MEEWRDSSALELCTGKHPVLEEEKQKEKLKSEQRQIPEKKPSGLHHGCGWKSRGEQRHTLFSWVSPPPPRPMPAQSRGAQCPWHTAPMACGSPRLTAPGKKGRPRSPPHWEGHSLLSLFHLHLNADSFPSPFFSQPFIAPSSTHHVIIYLFTVDL